ncbi:macro domain-containing protein [Kribbella sp. NPDC026611]|uniref:macro domain-containing protein n=1 Tax=Kribbella sp. NPDC026611 TaxID=3154911 RepID=UPI0034009AB2
MNQALHHDLKRQRFWRHFAVHALSAIGLIAVFAGLYDVFFPDVAGGVGTWLTIATVMLALIYAAWRSWPRPIEEQYETPNVKIRLVRGNILDQDADHLVIGMQTTFDTEPPRIVERTSLQAQFVEKIYGGDTRRLDANLDQALSGATPIGTITKPGKTKVYEVGTVAVLDHAARRIFCVAYSEMDKKNVARSSIENVWRGLDQLWREVTDHANGGTVAVPVIGGGLARLSQILPAQDSIRFIILSFMFACRRERVCEELKIVVQPAQYDRLDRLEIQAFLMSLRAS